MPNASLSAELTAHESAITSAKRSKRPYSAIAPKRKTYNFGDAELLALHFAPGNVILSDYWRTHDLVVAYHPSTAERGWYVEVVHCFADGTAKPFERVRTHYTFPDKRDIITAHVSQKVAA